ncbi:DNA-directed DNA polymerase [Marasmius tenuissimus]|nr:DNA-directed DNA polymerase [Marasmius tenuissimus]
MTTTLPLFWHLSSSSRDERLDASVKLISALEQFQSQHEVPSQASDDEEEFTKADPLDTMNAQDVSYSVRRLLRGLASSRESSRLGFSVALTELLSRLDTVTCAQITSLLLETTKAQGSSTGQEERDVLFARLFGFASIIHSGLLVRQTPLSTSPSSATQASSLSSYEDVLDQLISLGEKKSWLRESVWWTIGLAIDALDGSKVEWKEEARQATIEKLFSENKAWSPEKLALLLKIQKMGWKVGWRPLLSPTFKDTDVLSNGNLQTLALIMKEAAVEDESGDAQKNAGGSWKPQLHFIWDVILNILLPVSDPDAQKKSNFPEFFRIVVDEALFSSNASVERKYWGFQVFQKSLLRVTEDLMPMLFSKNFMRTWINHLSKKDRYLHKIATQTAMEVQKFVKDNPQLGFSLILQLTGVHGSQQFDKLTRTKTVENILTSMDTTAIKHYIAHLLKQSNDESVGIETCNSRRQWIIDQVSALIRNGAVVKDDEWVIQILDWLAVNGLFIVKKKKEKSRFIGLRAVPQPAFSDDLRRHCRTKLLSCLADLTVQATVIQEGESKVKVTGVASDREFWISKVSSSINELLADTKHVSSLVDMDEEISTVHEKTRQIVAKLKTVSEADKENASGVELLLSASIVQQYCAEENEVSIPLEELNETVRGFLLSKPKKKGRKSGGADDEAAEPDPVDILVDTILEFLEKSTAFMRAVGNQAFSLISSAAKESTIDLILEQLKRRDPSAEDDEEMEEGDSEGDDAEEGEDGDQDRDDETSSEEEDGDEGEGEDSGNEEPDGELRERIMEALAVNGIQAATGETDDDESEEEFMDDDQMMEIDQHLAEVFRMRLDETKKGKDTDAEREAIHFKNRVLDLVDIFLKKRPTSPLIIRVVLPLADVATRSTSDEKQLSDKAQGILRSRIGKHKELPSDFDIDSALTVLKNVHERASHARSTGDLSTLTDCSVFISHALISSGRAEDVVQLYRESLSDFLIRKSSSLNTAFFEEFLRRFQSEAWALRNDVLSLSEKAVNAYRRCQALQLLQHLSTHLPADSPKEVSEFIPQMQTTLFNCISNACDGKLTMTAPQVRELFKVALSASRQTQRTLPQDADKLLSGVQWGELSERLAASSRFKGTTQMCKQLVRRDKSEATAAKRKKSSHGTADGKKAKRKKVAHE